VAITLTRISRMYRTYDVEATLSNGDPAELAGVDIALLVPGSTPKVDTTWSAAAYVNGVATVLLAGPDADDTDALVVPAGGADLWIKVTDTPEIDAEKIERISVQ
jgi:hypothetical protein